MPGAVNRVISLQLTAFWQNHSNAIMGVGAAAACYGLWRTLVRTSEVGVVAPARIALKACTGPLLRAAVQAATTPTTT